MLGTLGVCDSLGVCHSQEVSQPSLPQSALVAGQRCYHGLHESRRFWRPDFLTMLRQTLALPSAAPDCLWDPIRAGDRNWDVQGAHQHCKLGHVPKRTRRSFLVRSRRQVDQRLCGAGMGLSLQLDCHWVQQVSYSFCSGAKMLVFVPTGPAAGQRIRNPVSEAGDQLPQRRAADSTEGNARGGFCKSSYCALLLRGCAYPFTPRFETIFNFSPECNSIPILVSSVKHSMYQLQTYPTKETVWEKIPFSVISPFIVTSNQI